MLTEEQVNGQVSETEATINKLVTESEAYVKEFNNRMATDKAEYARLQGRLEALKEMLAPT